ncbi:MAG TPA: FmdB family zinc ribbon protein [Bryobacteraceae bacterium]|nr:FmdB family zinc ribbon protein [Bryobacteraceae bacterium]
MPLYEYRCHQCGKTFEVLQKFADEPLAVHDECGGEVERLISHSSFQLKGSGWYVTDYGRNGKSSSHGGNGKSESKESKEGKTESKSESSKSEVKPPAATPSSSSTDK